MLGTESVGGIKTQNQLSKALIGLLNTQFIYIGQSSIFMNNTDELQKNTNIFFDLICVCLAHRCWPKYTEERQISPYIRDKIAKSIGIVFLHKR